MPVGSADPVFPEISRERSIIKTQDPHCYGAYLEVSVAQTLTALTDYRYDITFIRFSFDARYGTGKEPGMAA
jgi:hypothetical protein